MFNSKMAASSAREMYRVTYVKKYSSGDATYVKFFTSYTDMTRWMNDWQSDVFQILCIEEYIINKTGA
jgi:hypothetical protein